MLCSLVRFDGASKKNWLKGVRTFCGGLAAMGVSKEELISALTSDFYLNAVYGLLQQSSAKSIDCSDERVLDSLSTSSPVIRAVLSMMTTGRKRRIVPFLSKLGYTVYVTEQPGPFRVWRHVPPVNEHHSNMIFPTKYGLAALAFIAKLRVLVKNARKTPILVAFANRGLHGESLRLICDNYVVGRR